jgi:hypothetical protein
MFKRGGIVFDTVIFVVVFVLVTTVFDWFRTGTLTAPGVYFLPSLIGSYVGYLVGRKFYKRNKSTELVKP